MTEGKKLKGMDVSEVIMDELNFQDVVHMRLAKFAKYLLENDETPDDVLTENLPAYIEYIVREYRKGTLSDDVINKVISAREGGAPFICERAKSNKVDQDYWWAAIGVPSQTREQFLMTLKRRNVTRAERKNKVVCARNGAFGRRYF